jgi:hypothetical protein
MDYSIEHIAIILVSVSYSEPIKRPLPTLDLCIALAPGPNGSGNYTKPNEQCLEVPNPISNYDSPSNVRRHGWLDKLNPRPPPA